MTVEGTVQTIEVSASPQHVFEVALDLEAYPEWITACKSADILEEDDQGRPVRAEFLFHILIREITVTLRYTYELDDGFSWTAEPGPDLVALDGHYEFREIDDGATEVVYALRVEPAFTIPGFLRRQGEKELVQGALRGLKKRAEST
jgi:ribosome-associated toxin RatA of RatAB toxin-antitoxin module